MSRVSNHGKFFGRRRARPIDATEKPMQEEEALDPMSREGWVRWIELQWDLEATEIQDC
jgi:hypothetical protein